MATAREVARFLDDYVRTDSIVDYDGALNGLQLDAGRPVTRLGAAVDVSLQTISAAENAGVNMLLVHHGMFWGGVQPITDVRYERLRKLITSDIAVYASHLPLDAHPVIGNNVLLARALKLEPTAGFATHQGIAIGVSGECDMQTAMLVSVVRANSAEWGGDVRSSRFAADRTTRRWGICSGAGASSASLREAVARGIDTLIVGEGPHHTAVDAPDLGLVIIYAGHYATETLGVRELARVAAAEFGVPWDFLHDPTGL